ncbi:helix-turn-helix domain-containing protein [Marinicella rhabdoformis]|uniref:helix-turn-helix domain-containing protein n=1 Tax=Marinicella rhabdoformis TaxID=2580566 RepID=UPI0012AED385|nr:helix-turn-helix transcriptional regulator [Marinicella rhabdoformis]
MLVISYIYVIGAAQGLILAMALLRKQVNQTSNRLLGVWMLLLVTDLAVKVVYLNDQNTPLLFLYGLIKLFPFMYGSFFYLYVRTITTKQPIRWHDCVHFLGFLTMLGLVLPSQFEAVSYVPWWEAIFDWMLYSYSVSYVLAGLVTIRRYRSSLDQKLSNTDGISLLWIDVMAYFQAAIWLIALTQWLLPIEGYNFWMIYVAVALWMTVMAYLALNQQSIQPVEKLRPPEHIEDERFPEVDAKLGQLMNQEALYLDPTLTIGKLSMKSGYPEYLVSLVINQLHNQSFREYINQLRVEAAKWQLQQPDNKKTIIEIAFDCGFTAKSTFNTSFKKYTQMTPSEFKSKQFEAAE